MSEADNRRHWTDADRGVYEVWYMTWNHPETGQGLWLRFTTCAPVDGVAYGALWFARFDPADPSRTFGVHQRFPLDGATADPFTLRIAGGELGHEHTFGELVADGHDIRWDLVWDPAETTLRQLPDVMYRNGGVGETTFQSPNPRVPISGTILIDGEELAFDRAPFGQSHTWGKKHAFAWMWGRCAAFEGCDDAVMEVLSTRLVRRGITLPPLTIMQLWDGAEHYQLNQFRHTVLNRGTWGTGHARFFAWSPRVKIVGDFSARPEQIIDAPYVDPDGTPVWCANTEIGDARVTIYKRSGLAWREHKQLVARGTAHFESGSRSRSPAVERVHTRA